MTEAKKESTFELVKRIVKENLKVEDESTITMEAGFIDDLKADSLDIVEVIMAFETEFGVEIPDEDVTKIWKSTVKNFDCIFVCTIRICFFSLNLFKTIIKFHYHNT